VQTVSYRTKHNKCPRLTLNHGSSIFSLRLFHDFSLYQFEKNFSLISLLQLCHKTTYVNRSFIHEKGKIDSRKNTDHHRIASITMIDVRRVLIWAVKRRYVTTSLYPGLFCPTSFLEEQLLFTLACRFPSGSDQITSHAEALYPEKCGFPLHRIGDVMGLRVTTSDAIPTSYAPTFCSPSLSLICVPLICPFLGLTYDPTGLLRFSLALNDFISE